MSPDRFFVSLCMLIVPIGLIDFIGCDNLLNSSLVDVTSSNSTIKPNQASLIKLGFSGIFWNHIQSNAKSLDNLSPRCLSTLKHVSDLIESDNPEGLKFLSLSSHLPNKMFEVSYNDFESFDQCLMLQSTHYCQASVLPNDRTKYPHWFSLRYNTTIHIGFCLPNVCSPNEIDNLITTVIRSYDWEKVYFHGCQSPSTFLSRLTQANRSQLVAFLLLFGVVFAVVFASILDHLGLFGRVNTFKWLQHFALQQTHRNLINSPGNQKIQLIDQFRVLVSFIFQIVHAICIIAITNLLYTIEGLGNGKELITQWIYQPFNSDWIYGGLIYLGASSIAVHLWSVVKPNTPFTSYIWMFIKKLIQFWPISIVIIAVKIVLPLLGTGPIYTIHTQWRSAVCAKNWIYTLLHIHNYSNAFDMCCGHFWSMDAELHLFIAALVSVYLYKTRPKLGYVFNYLSMAIGLAMVFKVYYENNFVFRFVGYKFEDWERIENYVAKTYIDTRSHLFTYSLALLITFHCLKNPSVSTGVSKTLSRLISVTMTILIIMAAFSSGVYNSLAIESTPFWHALHAILIKVAVSGGFAWIGWVGLHDERVYRLMTRSKTDSNQNIIGKESNQESKSQQSASLVFKLMLATAKATYFSHWPLYVWFYSHKMKVYLDHRFIVDLSFLITSGYVSGLVFYYLVFGPMNSIISTFKRQTKSVKSD